MLRKLHSVFYRHYFNNARGILFLFFLSTTVFAIGAGVFLATTDHRRNIDSLVLDVPIGKINRMTLPFTGKEIGTPVQISVSPELQPFVFVTSNPMKSGDIHAGETYSVELTITAAPDAKPGVYRGTLSVPGYQDFPVTLTVLDPCMVGPGIADADGNGIADICDRTFTIAHRSRPVTGDISNPGHDDAMHLQTEPPRIKGDNDRTGGGDTIVGAGDSDTTPPDPGDTAIPVSEVPDTVGDDNIVGAGDSDATPPDPGATIPPKPLDPLALIHANHTPTRLAQGTNENFYVSDAFADAVFIYTPDLKLEGEIKTPPRPLGVTVDAYGNVYVGSDTNDTVDVYDNTGNHTRTLVSGVQMPTDLALDNSGQLYVVDSLGNSVRVYDTNGNWQRDLGWTGDGPGQLRFPVAVAISDTAGEVYVADQGHGLIQVYDMQGAFLRSYGGRAQAFSSDWHGKFVKLQSLAVDATGRLHALDSYLNKTQILDPATGAYIDSYGDFGTVAGKLNVPLDLWISGSGMVAVTNSGNHRVEYLDSASGK